MAQGYPTKPVRMIVGFSPGEFTDVLGGSPRKSCRNGSSDVKSFIALARKDPDKLRFASSGAGSDPCFNRTQEEPRAVRGFPFAAFGAVEGYCQSGFMLAAFTTFAALSTSLLMNAENSSGLLATTITPAEVSFSTTSGCCRAREISA